MVLFRARLRGLVTHLKTEGDEESFLVDVLRLYSLDPFIYLPLWFSVLGFSLFFFFNGLLFLFFGLCLFLVFHVLLVLVVFFFFWRVFQKRWIE